MATIEKRPGVNGTQYRVRIRKKGCAEQTATFDRLTDAKNWANEIESAIVGNRYFPTNELRKRTVADLIERYIKDVLSTKPKRARDALPQLNWWNKQIGFHSLSDLTPALLSETRQLLMREKGRQSEKMSNATINKYTITLNTALNIAVNEWQWLENNPMQKIKKLKMPRGRIRYLSDEEREALLKACSESQNPYLYKIVYLALSTGARHGEIMNLTWEQVDFKRKVITLYETKNGEIRLLPLVGKSYELMLEHSKVRRIDTDLVFPSSTRPQKPIEIKKAWVNALKKAGIEDFRFHDLRHSTASYLAMNGATLAEIAEVLGHKTLAMVKRYSHLSEAHTAGVLERMNKKFLGEG